MGWRQPGGDKKFVMMGTTLHVQEAQAGCGYNKSARKQWLW